MIARMTARTSSAALSITMLVYVACAPAGAPEPTAPSAAQAGSPPAASAPTSAAASATGGQDAWRQQWELTLAAAKQEGRVVVTGPPGESARQALTAFQDTYPEIQLEYSGARGADFISRVLAERRADRYLPDVLVSGTGGIIGELIPAGAVDPLKPALIRPEVL